MGQKRNKPARAPAEGQLQLSRTATPAEKLDASNARLNNKPNPSNALRCRMEASIESKARKKRSRETSASSALRGISKPAR